MAPQRIRFHLLVGHFVEDADKLDPPAMEIHAGNPRSDRPEGGFQKPVPDVVGRQLVELTGDPVGPVREDGELPRRHYPPSNDGEIAALLPILPEQPTANERDNLFGEGGNEHLEQRCVSQMVTGRGMSERRKCP